MVDRTDCAGTRAVRTAPEMMTRTYWSLPSNVLPVPGGASSEAPLSSLDHQHRAALERDLESAAEHVIRRQRHELRRRHDLDAVVAVVAPIAGASRALTVGPAHCDVDRAADTHGRVLHDIDDWLFIVGIHDAGVVGPRTGGRAAVAGPVNDRVPSSLARRVREGVLLPDRARDVEDAGDNQQYDRQHERELDHRLAALTLAVGEEVPQRAHGCGAL